MSLISASLYSEPYGITGNIGENFRRLLGAPSLDPLQTVIREAVQNVADSAKLGIGPEIIIRVRRLTANQRSVLSRNVLDDLPREQTSRDRLREFLDRKEAVVMEICDFGTSGLGGPTRADRIPFGTEETDFIDFLRNIGTPRDTEQGGGTYGFGKVALYQVSRCSTILVDSLVAGGVDAKRRLIGCHIGKSYEEPENGMHRRYTGRHWWGKPDSEDSIVDPVVGEEAEQLASALGFLPRGEGRTGTSIMILDFDNESGDLETVGHRIVELLLWNFWPRMMMDTPADRRFSCAVEVNGVSINIPSPEEFSPLHLFVKAMLAAKKVSGDGVYKIASRNPRKHLGILALEKGLHTPRRPLVDEDSIFPPVSKHIALMRPVELVVKYLEGEALPDERLEWGGVFIASSEHEVERAFANSEPPAHDNWNPNNLPKGRAKTYVNVALRELKDYALDMGNLANGQAPTTSSGPPLARVAGRLGMVLERVSGDGARRNGSTGGGGGGPRPARARASRPVFERIEHDGDSTIAVFSSEVRQDARRSGRVLTAKAAVAIEGTAAGSIDPLIVQPSVISIRQSNGGPTSLSDRVNLDGTEGCYEIFVRMPPDCAVTVDAEILSGE